MLIRGLVSLAGAMRASCATCVRRSRRYTEKLLDLFNIIAVKDQLKRLSHDNLILPVSRKLTAEMIAKEMLKRSKEISELTNSESMPAN